MNPNHDWELVIGIEVHVQLNTQSKLFSRAPTSFGSDPNTSVSFLDAALPGTLPSLNQETLFSAIRFGLAIGASIPEATRFARKNYFYPDLPKGYQISQMDEPIVGDGGGVLIYPKGKEPKRIAITRAHLEEDAGKSIHDLWSDQTAIDLNRAGTPLLEIVSEPDIRSQEEAVLYLRALHTLIQYLDISNGNMSEGSMRADINISVRKHGEQFLNPRSEIKNLNSFKFVEKAIDFEMDRHIAIYESGGTLPQETRLFDSIKEETRSLRSKETALDYRYFPDPDLLVIPITKAMIEVQRAKMPELPDVKRQKFEKESNLTPIEAQVLSDSLPLAQYYEVACLVSQAPKVTASWVLSELLGRLNKKNIALKDSPVAPEVLGSMVTMIQSGEISGKIGKMILDELFENKNQDLNILIQQKGWKQISDENELLSVVQKIISENAAEVAKYKEAPEHKKARFFGFFVGQTMKATQGSANPKFVNELLKKELDS